MTKKDTKGTINFSSNFASKFHKPELVKTAEINIAVGVNTAQKLLSPWLTGDLRRSITFLINDSEIVLGSHLKYAQKQEDRRGYLARGLQSQEQNIMRELGKAFEGNMK